MWRCSAATGHMRYKLKLTLAFSSPQSHTTPAQPLSHGRCGGRHGPREGQGAGAQVRGGEGQGRAPNHGRVAEVGLTFPPPCSPPPARDDESPSLTSLTVAPASRRPATSRRASFPGTRPRGSMPGLRARASLGSTSRTRGRTTRRCAGCGGRCPSCSATPPSAWARRRSGRKATLRPAWAHPQLPSRCCPLL